MLDKHLIAKTAPKANDLNIVFFNDYRITVLEDRLFRIEQSTSNSFNDNATQVVWFRNHSHIHFTVRYYEDFVEVDTKKAVLKVYKTFSKSYVILNGKKALLNNKGNLLGTYRTLDGCISDYNIYTKEKIKLCDGVCSKSGVAVLDDTSSLILDENGKLQDAFGNIRDVYVFAYGDDYKGAVKGLYGICGYTPLIPKYALGNWWSRYYSYTDKTYLNMLTRLEENRVPITVATIDMDWHYSDDVDKQKKITESGKDTEYYGGNSGWTGYSWNKDLFPDYKTFLKEIERRNYKITLNLHPAGGIRWFEDAYQEFALAMGIDPTTQQHIQFDIVDDNFLNNYFKILHKPYEKDGVRFWWIDWQQGTKTKKTGLDPLWSLNHYHFYDNAKNYQPLILSRFAGVGSHRYPLGFSGDTVIDWKSLKYIPYFTATASNVGYSWWSHDIGGHMYGIKDNELFLRYIQFGVFSPINRLHCTKGDVWTKETSYYSNGFGGVAEKFLRLRHALIPYTHSANYRTHKFGQALIEPIYYYEPNNKLAYKYKNSFYFGGELLAMPITKKSSYGSLTKTRVYLPHGEWTDFFTGDRYEGGREYQTVRWLDNFPLFAKAGAIIPMNKDYVGNSLDNPTNLELNIFNGNGKFDLYEDDDKEKLFITKIVSTYEKGKQTVKFSFDGDSSVMPKNRNIWLNFRNIFGGDVKAFANGKEIAFEKNCDTYLTVKLQDLDCFAEYEVVVEFIEQTKLDMLKRQAEYSIFHFEGANMIRHYLYHALKETKTVDEFKSVVYNFEKQMPEMDAQLIEEVRVLLSKEKHWNTLPKIYAERLLETL